MTTRQLVRIGVRGAVIGLILAVLASSGQGVSAEIWLVAVAVFVAWTLVERVLAVARVEPSRMHVVWHRPNQRHKRSPDRRPRALRTIDGLLLSARENPRAHAQRLRPRLSTLAAHHLRVRRGIDAVHGEARMVAVLGDVAWLIDPAVSDRQPTFAEIEAFLDIIETDDAGRTG